MRSVASLVVLLSLTAACRGGTDPDPEPLDLDQDGIADDVDCNDDDPAINPQAEEVCDGIDNNCDGAIDEGATDATAWYVDGDGDGSGVGAPTMGCDAPEGMVATSDDCDDTNAAIHPDAVEDDCTDATDYNCDGSVGYADADSDGVAACEDCDDSNADVNPGAPEVCDGLDNNCDSAVDEGVKSTFYADGDADMYGDAATSTEACAAPSGYVSDNTDCDDAEAASFPGNPEVCDGLDNNCDSAVDEGVKSTFYADGDADTYGDAAASTEACAAPSGYVSDNTDCDDAEAASFPGNPEVCDGLDNNCDSAVDEGVKSTFYADGDADAYGDAATSTEACAAPSGYVSDNTDCDDAEAASFPGNPEVCDGLDNNCDSAVDEGVKSTFYADVDGDTFGDPASSAQACSAPSAHVADNTDCDDSQADVHPGAIDLPLDGIDQDCVGGDFSPLVYGVDRYNGDVWAMDLLSDKVVWKANTGAQQIDVTRGPDGTLYVTDLGAGGVRTVSADGSTLGTLVASGLPGAHGIFYDHARDELLVTGSSGHVWSVDPVTGAVTVVVTYAGSTIDAFRFANSDDIWFTSRDTSEILRWVASTGTVELISKVTANAANLLVATPSGNLVTSGAGNGEVWEIDTRTHVATQQATLSLSAYGLCASPYKANELVVGDHASHYRLWSMADGLTDPAPTAVGTTWGCDADLLADGDGDGFVNALLGGDDCDDWSADINATAADTVGDGVDNNCDRVDGEDADGDGDPSVASGGHDCDDADPAVFWGTATCGGATSCEELLAANPTLPSGTYSLDLDGSGPDAAMDLYCDMETDGGGWTLGLVVNTVHDNIIFSNAQGWGFGSSYQDLHANAPLAADPAAASSSSQPMAAWIDLNTASYTHFRLGGYANGALGQLSDPIARSELRIDFGQNGYYLFQAPSDPARTDGKTYTWCGGDRQYTDSGVGQVNPVPSGFADCKGHGSLGSGWDFSFTDTGNAGFTLCGSAGASRFMTAAFGGTWYAYPAPAAAQAIWIR